VGSISIYCAREALADAGLDWDRTDKSRVGVYLGITEHGNVETENEIYNISKFQYDTKFWSHHHNPRTVANNPAGEVTLNLGITGPALHDRRGLCAAGNAGLIHAAQMLQLRRGRPRRSPAGVSARASTPSASSPASSRSAPGHPRRPDEGLAPVRQGPQRHRHLRRRLHLHA
jgi:3-oxoacyl-[acyl-carrier-protein] synthase II